MGVVKTQPGDADLEGAPLVNAEHARLVGLACRWLKRGLEDGGPGCIVVLSEPHVQGAAERPDALGYRPTTYSPGSVLVECKTSRADFLADAKKPFRREGGVGTWRFFLAPEGLISSDELPDRWGLIEATGKRLKVVAGPWTGVRRPSGLDEAWWRRPRNPSDPKARALDTMMAARKELPSVMEAYRHSPDHHLEQAFLIQRLRFAADHEKATETIRELRRMLLAANRRRAEAESTLANRGLSMALEIAELRRRLGEAPGAEREAPTAAPKATPRQATERERAAELSAPRGIGSVEA